MKNNEIITWLLQSDVSIQYQAYKDLLGDDRKDLQKRIATEGWGAKFLSLRKPDGHWGRDFYQPKWISTHYTLLDLRHLWISPNIQTIRETIDLVLETRKSEDGGVNPAREIKESDVCVNGMFLNYACYFGAEEEKLKSIIDYILSQRMKDGGFNCRFNRSGARHSSLHSTISLMEGIFEYIKNGYRYRLDELKEAEATSKEFVLMHQLFISDRTGEIIKKEFLRLPFPSRWKFDILRALDYFQYSGSPYDPRMQPAIDVLLKKRRKDNRWNLQAHHPGQRHFDMEKVGKASRWNTLRALRALKNIKE